MAWGFCGRGDERETQQVAIAPRLDAAERGLIEARGCLAEDLTDLCRGL